MHAEPTNLSKPRRNSKRPRHMALAAAIALMAGLVPASAAVAATTAKDSAAVPTGAIAAFGHQTLTWQACGTFQCSTLTVPQSYLDPAGPVFRLPVIKAPATDPAHRVGTLFFNPGGPAASGVAALQGELTLLSPNLRAHFDIVAWDRRGTAGSDPALHCGSDTALDAYNHLDPDPATAAGLSALYQAGRTLAASCRANSAPGLLSDAGSIATAFDTDVLRSAIGERTVNYFAFSYGTFQGAWYAELFPTHVRTMSLDGMLDPAHSGPQNMVAQAAAFERELTYYIDDCNTAMPGQCPAATPDGIRAVIDGLETRLRAAPLAVPGTGRTVGPAELTAILEEIAVAPGTDPATANWPGASQDLIHAAAGDGTSMLADADFWFGRNPDGTHDGTEVDGENLICSDSPWPTTQDGYSQLLSAAEAAGPHFGGARAGDGLPCTGWDAPTAFPAPLTAAGAPPILVVSTTGDPATPYQMGADVAHTLAKGVLLTWQGHGHTAYGRSNSCVTDNVDTYLITGTPPAVGTVC